MSDKRSPFLRGLRRLGANWVFALAVACVTMLPVGFFIGEYSAYTNVGPSIGDYASRISELQDTLDVALGELEVQRTRSEVDARALEMLRQEMAAEQERMAELEEGLGFYRTMLSSDNEEGLYLHSPELVPGAVADRVAYRIIVQHKGRNADMVEGELLVEVRGTREDEEASYPLGDLSEEFSHGSAALHFRYFQSIEGEMSVPEGFAPRELILVARTGKPDETEVREVYPWELQERLINVGE